VHQRKGIARYHLTVKGIGAHAGVDYAKGRSAVEELAHWIIALQSATNLGKETTVNVGIIDGGTSINAIPSEASADVDVRYYDAQEVERIEKLMKTMAAHPHVPDTQVTIDGGITRPPMLPSDKTKHLCAAIDAIGTDLNIRFGWTASGGGSDGSFSAFAGVPTIDGLGPVGGGAHSVGEYMEIPTVEPRLKLLEHVITYIINSPA
jgi:glutamate carboxypeptidase